MREHQRRELTADDQPSPLVAPVVMGAAQVDEVQVQEVGGQAFVTLATATRKASVARLTIGPAAFDELVRLIEERVAAARAA